MARLPILKFKPILLPKPWGGDGLWRVLRKGASCDADMGESWELSTRPEAETVVVEGPLAGKTLSFLVQAHGIDLLGPSGFPSAFPLLYKFIFAREKLSVQVHPGAGSPWGEAKTECWYVVDAAPGAELILGVSGGGLSRAEILESLRSADCEKVLRRLPARCGNVFFIPAGTVHAITEGLLLYEVQQNSDTTFRLYDWGRVNVKGEPRALHVEEASQVADLQEREGYQIPGLRVRRNSHTEDYLVACPYFALMKWTGFQAPARLETSGKFRVVTVVEGSVSICGEDSTIHMALGETALIPACIPQVTLEAALEAEVLVSFVPDLESDIRSPLRAAGHAEADIAKIFGPAGIKV